MTTNSDIAPAAEQVEGPFYGRGGPLRHDIRDGRPGLPLALEIVVVDQETRKPLDGVKVDLWQCDAHGFYSGYEVKPDEQPANVVTADPVNDETWLRGAQMTDADGQVSFLTVYPGFYITRSPHIHLKLFVGDDCILTSQLYMPDDFSQAVYARSEYARDVEQDSHNATDLVIALSDGPVDGLWIEVEEDGDGYRGASRLAVDLDARSNPTGPPPQFQPPVGGVAHGKAVR